MPPRQNPVDRYTHLKESTTQPYHPAKSRALLREGKAAVYRQFPFTIILKDRERGDLQPIELKVEPGSKTSKMALVGAFKRSKFPDLKTGFLAANQITIPKIFIATLNASRQLRRHKEIHASHTD